MDGRIDHFSYLIEEVESDFFQKTAEEIAVSSIPQQSSVQDDIYTIVSDGFGPTVEFEQIEKLASLIRKSNQLGMTKEAESQLLSGWNDYSSLLSVVAAASNEQEGMAKTACDVVFAMEEVLAGHGSLDKVASHLVLDSLWVDAVSGGLTKEAVGGIRAFLAAAKALPKAFGGAAKAIRHPIQSIRQHGVKGYAQRVGRAIEAPVQKAYHGTQAKILGKHIQRSRGNISKDVAARESLRKQIASSKDPTTRAELGTRLKGVEKSIETQTKRRMSAKRQLLKSERASGADYVKPTFRKSLKGQAAQARLDRKRSAAKRSRDEGAAKAREAAKAPEPTPPAPGGKPDLKLVPPVQPKTGPTGAPKPTGKRDPAQVDTRNLKQNLDVDPHGPPTREGQGPSPVRKQPIGNVDTSEAQRAAAETGKKMEGFGGQAKTKAQREADEASARARKRAEEIYEGKAGVSTGAPKPKADAPQPKQRTSQDPGYRKQKGPEANKKQAPDKKPAPEKSPGPRPPKEDVEGKGMGVMDAWTKWGKDGWGALSDAEKSRLIRAGVMAGGGAAAYKTVFGD